MADEKKKQEETSTAPAGGPQYPVPSDSHIEEGTDLGSIRIHNNVISVIARLAARRVPGVVDLSGNLVDDLAGMIGKKSSDRGIRIEIEEDAVFIDVYVTLEYGVTIPQTAWQIQNDIREAVQDMTGKTVRAVNVIVQGIRVPESEQSEEGEYA